MYVCLQLERVVHIRTYTLHTLVHSRPDKPRHIRKYSNYVINEYTYIRSVYIQVRTCMYVLLCVHTVSTVLVAYCI